MRQIIAIENKRIPIRMKFNFAHQNPQAAEVINSCIQEGKQFKIHEKNTAGSLWDPVKLVSIDIHNRASHTYNNLEDFLYSLGFMFSVALIEMVEPLNKKIEQQPKKQIEDANTFQINEQGETEEVFNDPEIDS